MKEGVGVFEVKTKEKTECSTLAAVLCEKGTKARASSEVFQRISTSGTEWAAWKSTNAETKPQPDSASQAPLQRPSATSLLAVAAPGGTPSTDRQHQVLKKARREQEHQHTSAAC